MFKHKIKEYFPYKIRQKDNDIFTTRLLSSQQLMHFFFNFSGVFFDILPFLSLPILSRTTMAIKQLECFSCVIVATNWFWTLQYYYLKLLFLQIRFYFHVNQLKIVNCKDWNLIKLYIPYLFVANRNLLLNKG